MSLIKSFLVVGLTLCAASALSAGTADSPFPVGTEVVTVVSEFTPTRIEPEISGYTKPLVIHPGKRGVVIKLDPDRSDIVSVKWEEQYWQEWSNPAIEDYLDSSRSFMSQTGPWIKWKSFISTINVANLVRPVERKIDTSRLSLVKENHAEISKNGQTYILDSYIVLFQRPYYILVRKSPKEPLTLDEASSIAEEYIKPRGCTTPLSRRVDLDKSTINKSEWLIGIEC